jgi:tRNA pseudouridine38-40 synthase
MSRYRIGVIGAGRTDSGVHATGQVISFRAETGLTEAVLERALNALLPGDVAVRELKRVEDDFHARYSAMGRTYEYTIWNRPWRRPLLRRTAWWLAEPLDAEAMRDAAGRLVGRHDFSSFAMRGEGSRERTVRSASWTERDGALVFAIEADGFLRGMVRGIVGTHVRVGSGTVEAGALEEIMAAADRDRGAASAPARGLCLVAVSYADGRAEARPPAGEEEDE